MHNHILIRELADKLQISPRAIRFYEEKGLITPEKDPENNYRLFSEADAWQLQTIIALREVGMTIREVKNILEEMDKGDHHKIRYYLNLQRSAMFFEWIRLKQMIETIDDMIDSFDHQSLDWEDVFKLASRSKQLWNKRLNWKDRWNFDAQAAYYDKVLPDEVDGFNPHLDYDQALAQTVHFIAPQLGEKGLDLGTGTGNLAGLCLKKGAKMSGVDQSWEMLQYCQTKYPQMETRLGNFLAIPFFDHSFDFIVTSYALHHLTDDQKLLALEEMHRVLKPGGRLCIADLMFASDKARQAYYHLLRNRSQEHIISIIEDEYYADRSRLLAWLKENKYQTTTKQINEIFHLVYAKQSE